jgi:hypothetical protein
VADRRARIRTAYGSWVPGFVLIGLGLIFLAQNYFDVEVRNWWALFILIPAFFTVERAYAHYAAGDAHLAVGPAIGGVVLVGLAVALGFDLPLGQLWPLLLIAAGIAALFSRRPSRVGP